MDARALARLSAALLLASACASTPMPVVERMSLSSPAIGPDGRIPIEHTCDGSDAPLPLRWGGVPEDAVELAVTMRDPDAPRGDFVHWIVTGLDPDEHATGLKPGGAPAKSRNDFGELGYGGPCPPEGRTHEYLIKVHALAAPFVVRAGAPAREVADRIEAARTDGATLSAIYGR